MAAVVRPPVPERVIDVDERTDAAIQAMFERRGYGRNEPLVRARLLFHADRIGYDAPAIDEPMEARLNLTPRYLETFGGVAPPGADPASFRAYATAQADAKDETGPGAAR